MPARHFSSPRCSNVPHATRFLTASPILSLILAFPFVPTMALGYGLDSTGRWTPAVALGGTQVHMALLPSDGNPWHSKVVWWYGLGEHEEFYGGLLKWKPGEYDCTSFPGTSLIDSVTLATLPPGGAGVFCSSNSLLDGRLFLAGGTQPGTEYGVNHVFLFDPATEQWVTVDSMGIGVRRWYPSSTALAARGRQLVLGGGRYPQIDFLGGLVSGNAVPTDSAVFRYGMGGNGMLDGAVRQSMTPQRWPEPREGHTAIAYGATTYVFGGKGRSGYLGDFWHLGRKDSALRADYDYEWQRLDISGDAPPARWEHSAIRVTNDPDAVMIVYGGIRKSPEDSTDVVLSDVWRLYWNQSPPGYLWHKLEVTTPPALGTRWGHSAVYDSTRKRMIVFGGRSTTTGPPTSGATWVLKFSNDFTSGEWEDLGLSGPSARFDHAIGSADAGPDTFYVFGGNQDSTKLNDLWRFTNGPTPSWQQISDLSGNYPSPRSKHSALLLGHMLMVFGGRSDDSTVHVAHLESHAQGEVRAWTSFVSHPPALSGHTAVFSNLPQERTPQIFNPAAASGSQWTSLTDAPRLLDWYPQAYVWKPDTVFVTGPDRAGWKLALGPTPKWSRYPDDSSTMRGGCSVMYRPGKVMKCGARDTDGRGPAIGTTQHLDLNLQSAGKWRNSTNAMAPRVNHNLVLLPNGRVFVVGGTSSTVGTAAEHRPEIWDPDYASGQDQGRWEGLGVLASHTIDRDYHSTALLLPDARILTGGGEHNQDTRHKVEIFCPPYLFKPDGSLATRPAAIEAPRMVSYGATLTRCVPATDTIAIVSLIRPAAVTHGFDQNQRYVPLSFARTSATNLEVTFPPDSAVAPPGEYLLFLVNNKGVPSIGRWVRMAPPGDPAADVTAPAEVDTLVRDMVTNNAVNLTWVAPGDDGTTGTAAKVELRYSQSPITPGNFCQATLVTPGPAPGSGGSGRQVLVQGLQQCRTYYFAMKYWDEASNAPVFGDTTVAHTLCECCMGEVRARMGREDGASPSSGGAPVVPSSAGRSVEATSAAAAAAVAGLVVEVVPGTTGLDLAMYPITGEFEGRTVASDGVVVLQRLDAEGGWTDQVEYGLPAENRFALSTPERPARWVILAPCALEGVLPAVRSAGAAWRLTSAMHSQAGDVTSALASADSMPNLGAGDTLRTHYSSAPDTSASTRDWLLLLARATGGASPTRTGRRPAADGRVVPSAFALHRNHPNPFAEQTTIRFALPVASRVRLDVFDLLGRRVRTLAKARFDAGEHEVAWDRRTDRGPLAAPGLYFVRMEAGAYRAKVAMMIAP